MTQKRFLFVLGVARSGTTALAAMLNSNKNVALGIERFIKYKSHLAEEMFAEKNFFDFEAYECSEQCQRSTLALADRYRSALIVGDKIPSLYRSMGGFGPRFSDITFITILRDALAVACSWNGRAEREAGWPFWKRDVLSVVEHQQMWTSLLSYSRPEQVVLVDYETAFGGDVMAFARRLSNEIEMDPDIDVEAMNAVVRRSASRKMMAKASTLEEEAAKIVTSNVEPDIRNYLRESGGLCRLATMPSELRERAREYYGKRRSIGEIATTHLLERFGDEYRANLLTLRGRYRAETGRLDEAASDFQAALTIAPQFGAAKRALRMVRERAP